METRARAAGLRVRVASTGQLVEIDEVEHFTTARPTTLGAYSSKIPFGFSIDDYRSLIETWKAQANSAFTQRWSPDFDSSEGDGRNGPTTTPSRTGWPRPSPACRCCGWRSPMGIFGQPPDGCSARSLSDELDYRRGS